MFTHCFKRISKVIPSQASVLFSILFNFQGPRCLSRQPLYITTSLLVCQHFFVTFLKLFQSFLWFSLPSRDSLIILTQISLGIFACRKLEYTPPKATPIDKTPLSNALVISTESGIHSIFSMCGMVIVFSSVFGLFEDLHITEHLIALLGAFGINDSIALSFLSSLWEVTKGCNTCCDLSAPLWLTAFALGWGGICVHFQIYSLTSSINIPKTKFTLYRLAQGVISAVITAIVFTFYTPATQTYNAQADVPIVCNNYIGSIALVMMCIIFTLSVTQKSNPKLMQRSV